MAVSPDDMQRKATGLLRQATAEGLETGTLPDDSSIVWQNTNLIRSVYAETEYAPRWSFEERWLPGADSLYRFIEEARLYGLFPSDYHLRELQDIRDRFFADSQARQDRKDAALWVKADLLLTDAFFRVIKDIKLGRLPQDSISLRGDSVLPDTFYREQLARLPQTGLYALIGSLEPSHKGYRELKEAIPQFLSSGKGKTYSPVPYPEKDKAKRDRALQKRLHEGGYIPQDSVAADSATLAAAIRKFQQESGLSPDGVAGEATIRMMNENDRDKFLRIAISLDKYKMLPPALPSRYIWVNTAANVLDLVDGGTVKLHSRVISGKPKTRTPLLNSAISELITYPQWIPPPSIVMKEILPAVKRNPGYLARKGFSLVDSKGNEVDPYTVDWSKYSKGIPYRVVQGSGDANALGIMKFVFSNKYSVYLHDTNQRYLFANAYRSLSHGCVRVQDWEKLAFMILDFDKGSGGSGSRADSVRSWLRQKQKKSIPVRSKLPIFIRYITCAGENGRLTFYDDVYGEDKMLAEKYFAGK